MTGRYVFTPMTAKKIGRRVTLADRFRRWNIQRKQVKPDLMRVTGYYYPMRGVR